MNKLIYDTANGKSIITPRMKREIAYNQVKSKIKAISKTIDKNVYFMFRKINIHDIKLQKEVLKMEINTDTSEESCFSGSDFYDYGLEEVHNLKDDDLLTLDF